MRILNEDNDKKCDYVLLYLTRLEADELVGKLPNIINSPKQNHIHINDSTYQKQLTVCIYDEKSLEGYGFDERSLKLISKDE